MNAPVQVKKRNERSAPQNSPTEIRQAYPYFHTKRTKNAAGVPFTKKNGTPNPRFSGTFMFPKLSNDPSQCANYRFLLGMAYEAAQKMWPQSVDQNGRWAWPPGAQIDIKDGDVPFQSKPKPGQPIPNPEEVAKKNAWRKGYWIVEAENFLPNAIIRVAKVVNGQIVDIPAETINGVEQYKSGDYGYPNLHAYAYENETFGVNFGFDGFLFTREGERIGNAGGPKSATQMFGDVAGAVGNSSMPGPATIAYAAPVAAPPSPPPAAPLAPQPQAYAPPVAPVAYAAPAAPPPPPAPAMVAAGHPPLPPIPGR